MLSCFRTQMVRKYRYLSDPLKITIERIELLSGPIAIRRKIGGCNLDSFCIVRASFLQSSAYSREHGELRIRINIASYPQIKYLSESDSRPFFYHQSDEHQCCTDLTAQLKLLQCPIETHS